MNDGNAYNGYYNDSDKCPKCGAVKMFSALVCPSCGTKYADAARMSNNQGNTGFINQPTNNFDPNASFAAFKKSLEPQNESGTENGNNSSPEETSVLSNIAELEKPVELDPIAKKLQEMAQQNNTAGTAGTPNRGQFQGSPYQSGQPYQGTPYQGQGGGQPYQNGYQNQPYQGGAPYQGQPMNNGYSGSPYTSPYSRTPYTNINTVPDNSNNKASKIFILAVLIILAGMIGFGVYRYSNCDKNDKGIAYTTGKSEYGTYTNEWADIKIDLMNDDIRDYTYMAYDRSFQSEVNMGNSLKNKNADYEFNFIGVKEMKVGSTIAPIPCAMIVTITDNGIGSKIFGVKLDDYFDDSNIDNSMLPAGCSFTKESDMLLGGHAYKTYCVSVPYDDLYNMKMYMCARAIGNRIVLIYLYDIPDIIDLATLKKHFSMN